LLAGNDMQLLILTKDWLFSNFEMKDFGEANFILGVKIIRDRSKKFLGLQQPIYKRSYSGSGWKIQKLLKPL
ncbi:hypothetical protein PJI17_30730, partial [Mycobacterium kansasii]